MPFSLRRKVVLATLAAAIGLGAAGAADAHHSFAMFDRTKTVTLKGTVRNWQWTNPHSWLWIIVDDGGGKTTIWGLEGTAPGELTRKGWTRNSLKAGDKVTVVINPLKDGRAGGAFHEVRLADGTLLTDKLGPKP